MSIEKHYDKTASVKRLDYVPGSTVKQTYATLHASVPCHLQPLVDETSQNITGGFGKDWLMFCADRDIREGDRVTIDGNEYKVFGVDRLNFKGVNQHMELRLNIFNE